MRNKMKALVTLLLCLVTVLAFGLLLTACGETDESGKNPGGGGTAHTHTPDNVWHVDSTAGTHYHECTVCHEHVEEAAHVEETLAAVQATCTSKGKTAGKKCSVCDTILVEQTETEMIAHTSDETWHVDEAKGTHYHTCTVCTSRIDEAAHEEETIPEVKATCTSKGKTAGKKCSVCDAILEEQTETDMIAHTPDETWHVDEAKGTHYHTCTVCTSRIDEAAHEEETIPEVKATCTSKGKTAGKKCSVCETVLQAQTETEMTDHTPGKTYTDDGNGGHYQECTVCKAKVNEAKHSAGADAQWQIEGDKHYRNCAACNARIDEAEHYADPHSTWYPSETGHFHKCQTCGQPLAESPHTATKSEDLGWFDMEQHNLKKCTVCGKTDVTEEHKFTLYSQTPSDPTKTYAYSCPGCGLMPFRYTRLDDGTQNYQVDLIPSFNAKNFPAESEEFTFTIPSSFTVDGEVKKVTKTYGLVGGSPSSSSPNFKLKKLVISEGIEKVSGTFEYLSYLETVVIPEGVSTLYVRQFAHNPKLKSIVIPKSVTEVMRGDTLVDSGDPKPTAYFLGNQQEWKSNIFGAKAFTAIKYYSTDWHWEDETKKDTPVDGAKPVALLPTMITTTQARKREI